MRLLIVSLGMLFAAVAMADDRKPEEKKPEAKKAAPKKAAKSDKNAAQKAEASTGKFLKDTKIWTGSRNRSTD